MTASFLAAWIVFAQEVGQDDRADSPAVPGSPPDPLAASGYAVTSGAAAGYVDDRVCRGCHADLYRAYGEVGMAKAFYRPRAETAIEDFEDNRFFHQRSRRVYEMTRRDGDYLFRRYQLDAEGRRVNVFEQEVDWILGSGHHARTYLYRTPAGELYQLPIAWYAQTASWGMAPGFDRRDHEGVRRRVRRECMFCHNAYPDVAPGADLRDAPQVFPEELPEGLGCQRCHGPGAEHARLGMREPVDFSALASSIVNPGRLPRHLRDDVCYGCHMQPSVALPGVRRFGRGDYSFRPGEPLPDYLAQVDVDDAGRPRSDRFEINHHPYRLEQSRCFRESDGALSCLSCHDPHRKVPVGERAAHYRAACLGCHEIDGCRREEMAAPASLGEAPIDPGDCAACHMPRRRTQDVVQVVMTDHFIRRRPGGAELTAPLEESEPELVGVELLQGERLPGGALGEVYRAAAVVHAGGGAAAVDRLERMLAEARPAELDPYFDLARGQLAQQRFKAASKTVAAILERSPAHPVAKGWQGIAWAALGRREEAIELLRKVVDRDPERAEWSFNLGGLLSRSGRLAEAAAYLEKAVASRPNFLPAHFHLGNAYSRLGQFDKAVGSYRRALEIEPSDADSYLALARAQLALGESAAALSTLRHGVRVASRPGPIVEALARVTALPSDAR